MNRFLLDEHLPTHWRRALLRRAPTLTVWHTNDPGAPPNGATDRDILLWCEGHDFYFLTNNRSTMPGELADHVSAGHHTPGVFMVRPDFPIIELADQLLLIDGAALPDEFRDGFHYLPLT
jgi:hypothetical protein